MPPEDRAAMIAAVRVDSPPMCPQALPQCAACASFSRVSTNAHDARAIPCIRAFLTDFAEEIDAPARPIHAPGTMGEDSGAIGLSLQSSKDFIEPL